MSSSAIVDWWKVFFFVNENWAHKSGSNLLFAERQHLISEWRNFKMFFLHSDRRSKKEESRRTRIKQVLWNFMVSCYALHRWTGIVIHSMRPVVPISSHLRSGRDGSCRCHAGDLRKQWSFEPGKLQQSSDLGRKCKWYLRHVGYIGYSMFWVYIYIYKYVWSYFCIYFVIFYNLNTETYYIYMHSTYT